jgi:hypothetical protein
MAIVDLDNHILQRLALIQLGTAAVPVYAYDVYRAKGITRYPCIAIERQSVQIRYEDSKPFVDLYVASVAQQTITVQRELGGGEMTGPQSYTRKKFPTPVNVHYMLDLFATTRIQSDAMLELLIGEVIPPGYQPKIGSRYVTFVYSEITNLDKLEHPIFRNHCRWMVTDFYLDKLDSVIVPPIFTTEIDMQTENRNYGEEI